MINAVFPGTFDPITKGHTDIIERVAKMAESLTVLVATNSAKTSFFTAVERVEHIRFLTEHLDNVRTESANMLVADFAKKIGATVIVRGIRNGSDFDYEMQLAEVQRKVEPGIETLFIAARPEFCYLSSTVVKEIFSYGGDIGSMVSEYVAERLSEKK